MGGEGEEEGGGISKGVVVIMAGGEKFSDNQRDRN